MRPVIFAVAVSCAAFAIPSIPAAAQTAQHFPWCAQATEQSVECIFVSEQQCLEGISGEGGYCERNPEFFEAVPMAPGRHSRRHKHG